MNNNNKLIIMALMLILCLAACWEGISAVPLPLFDPSQVTSIRLIDNWTGLSPLAPINAEFTLAKDDAGFGGEARFSVAGYTNPISDTISISIPSQEAQAFLQLLARSPLAKGTYTPYISHTDDYPHLEIELQLTDGAVFFLSDSQGEMHTPWRVAIDGKDYVSYSDTIMQAIEKIRPYLGYETQKELFKQAEQSINE